MAKFGLIAGSYKPYHVGHDLIIRLAANENDFVKVFVSTTSRKRKNELTIDGNVMYDIWIKWIIPSLPDNVHVEFGGSPIRKIYEFLGNENELGSEDRYKIYSDPVDLARNFPRGSLEKYMNELYSKGLIQLEPISRNETVDVSGTMMRNWLVMNDSESFIKNLPKSLQLNGTEIFEMLKS